MQQNVHPSVRVATLSTPDCDTMRKAMKASKNWHKIEQNEHTPEQTDRHD